MNNIDAQNSPQDPLEARMLEAVRAVVDQFPQPNPGDRNLRHLMLPDGSMEVRAVPWIDPTTGEAIADVPDWFGGLFPGTVASKKADLVANLPDSDQRPRLGRSRQFRNPLTGDIVVKEAPWLDERGIVMEDYVPGIEVSLGRKIAYNHNPDEEFDDPGDNDNLRFLSWISDIGRAITTAFRDLGRPQRMLTARAREELKDTGIIGVNLGGTIMMEQTPDGLVPTGTILDAFKEYCSERFPNIDLGSFSFPKTRPTAESPDAYGMDSSQMEIDFIGDMALAMTAIWNSLPSDRKKAFAGFVITLGTDTSVEAVTLLKMMLGPNCPFSVIAVGAMKPMGQESSEGPANFQKAIEHLNTLHKQGLATIALRVEGGLYEPSKTHKKSDQIAAAFQGAKLIDTEQFETVEKVADRFYSVPEYAYEQDYTGTVVMRGPTLVKDISSKISRDPMELEEEIAKSSAQAILVKAYPSFTTAMNAQNAILRGAKGRPVFYINPIQGGKIEHDYEVAKTLAKQGVHSLQLTEHAAEAKLNYALRVFSNDPQKIVDFMMKNDFIGEQPESFSPYSHETMEDVDVLKTRIYQYYGITPAMIDEFGSEEFLMSPIQALKRRGIERVTGSEILDPYDDEKYDFAKYQAYQALQHLGVSGLIDFILSDQELTRFIVETDSQLWASIQRGTVSTVNNVGTPVDMDFDVVD